MKINLLKIVINLGDASKVQSLIDRGVELNRGYITRYIEHCYPLQYSIRQNWHGSTFDPITKYINFFAQ